MNVTDPHFPGITIDDSNERIDAVQVWSWLKDCYWCKGIPQDTVVRAIRGSICFGMYEGEHMVAFARVVTDRATFAWLCDVVVDPSHRGRGLGTWLAGAVRDHPELQGLRRFLLATADAHEVYRRVGFVPSNAPDRFMEIVDREIYQRQGG